MQHIQETIRTVTDEIGRLQSLLTALHTFHATLTGAAALSAPAVPRGTKPRRRQGRGRHPRPPRIPRRRQAEPAAPEEKTGPGAGIDPNKLTPLSPRGIELAAKLNPEFNMDELAALLPAGKPAAYYWAKQWRDKNWIEKTDEDVFHKGKKFGQ